MLALYRCGRQADALAAYQQARRVLADELGLEPGAELQRLQQAILTADPSLDLPAAPAPPVPAAAVPSPPAQLPADIADFTGRAKQTALVRDVLISGTDNEDRSSAVVVLAIAGKAGVGKTTLAVHAAHQARADFPDGQLYVNLRGAEAHPLEPCVAARAG